MEEPNGATPNCSCILISSAPDTRARTSTCPLIGRHGKGNTVKRWYLHEGKAQPLCAELGDTQKTSNALERVNLSTAGNGLSGRGHRQDVGKPGGGRRGAKEDKVRRYTLGSASCNDAVMLGHVREEDADENDAMTRLAVCAMLVCGCQSYYNIHGNNKFRVRWRLELVADMGVVKDVHIFGSFACETRLGETMLSRQEYLRLTQATSKSGRS
jgi:hypothetical protein